MWLLARRNLGVRPGRTVLFLAGFSLAVGVMIALLSVGEAIVGQARDKDLVGGADIVLVPEGSDVEVLKLGGVTAMFSTIPNARFLYRQLLRGPRFADAIKEAAPTWAGRPVFLRARPGGPIIQGLASATVPSLERAVGTSSLPAPWIDSPGEARFATLAGPALYAEMDHGHRPDSAHPDAERWAEWWYFNLLDAGSGRFAYLSFFVAGDPRSGRARGSLSIQLGAPGQEVVRHAFVVPVDSSAVALDDVAVTIAGVRDRATVRVAGGVYRLSARFRDAVSGRPVALDLDVVPAPRAYFPPLVLRGSGGFESGYVVPAVLARATGTIDVGDQRTSFADALAYHDHNWGYWREVTWDWGQVQSLDLRFALVYGSIRAPELEDADQDHQHYAIVSADDGFLGVLRPDSIAYGAWHEGPVVAGRRARVPGTIGFVARSGPDSLDVTLAVEDVAASLPAGDPRQRGPRLGAGRAFLQMRGRWTVRGKVGGRAMQFAAPGAAETFVEL